MFGRLAQVVYTLTQFPTVTGVTFRLDGQPVTTFSGEGIVLTGPSVRADYRDFLPAIFMDAPAWGSTLANPARVSGVANVFEAQFAVEIVASDGTVLANADRLGVVRHRVLGHVRRHDPVPGRLGRSRGGSRSSTSRRVTARARTSARTR